MNEPTTYALPDEPNGPVWDKFGKRWTPADVDGWWISDATGGRCTWARVLQGYGPLTSTPPWKPEVGGIVETREQYEAMPLGSIVACDQNEAWWLDVFGVWNSSFAKTNLAAPSTGATILRVGWEA